MAAAAQSANSVSTYLKEVIPDDYRIIVCLAKTATSIIVKILNKKRLTHINRFHTIIEELHEWHITAAASYFLSPTRPDSSNPTLANNVQQEFDDFAERLNDIVGFARFLKEEMGERAQRNPQVAVNNTPSEYDRIEDRLSDIMTMLTGFLETFKL